MEFDLAKELMVDVGRALGRLFRMETLGASWSRRACCKAGANLLPASQPKLGRTDQEARALVLIAHSNRGFH